MKSASSMAAYMYLLLVPFLATAIGFGIGHVHYQVYLPVWLLNVILMVLACRQLGLKAVRSQHKAAASLARAACCWILPWILISLFAGLGPPPETAAEWTATATEQQVRYFMLVICGVSLAWGFASMKSRLKAAGEERWAPLAFVTLLLAMPLFLVNMLYWGFYLTELFRIQSAAGATSLPDWVQPLRQLFGAVSVVEVGLTYLATFLVAWSMRKAGWLGKIPASLYAAFSILAMLLVVLSAFFTEPLRIPGFALSIPAFPFLMPYFMGVHLLRRAGQQTDPESGQAS